ncbi:MAG TPA: formylmethanofuran dehydrogenase subunit C [Burkholderiaceae bacterium]|nr:formylmethanofuran dehydrogenase subunit C [Burkholderiaceae bacterium]
MSGWRLTLRQAPAVRVDLRGVLPSALVGLSAAQVGQLPVGHGNALVPLAEFFDVQAGGADDTLALAGDLSRFDRVGWQMGSGRLTVDGPTGHYAGGCMSGGELRVQGDVGLLAACEMAGGLFTIEGNAGDFAASTLPGSMDGMRGGTLVVKGDVGERFGDRMRRGTALVFGNAGDFLASRMVAGSIALGGRAGAHAGYGMRRGSVVFATAAPTIAPTFVPALVDPAVFWQLLARDLARHGGPFAALPSRSIVRHLGDLASDGRGELIVAR